MSARIDQLKKWLCDTLPCDSIQLCPVSGDASFRHYYRFSHEGVSYIVMDAPPEQEDCRPFVARANLLAQLGIHVPTIVTADLAQGFLVLSDLGDQLYLTELNAENAHLFTTQ